MPRWRTGLHTAAGSQLAIGARPIRPQATDQRDYWRHAVAELHAGASITWPSPLPSFSPSAAKTASAGPQGAGERWVIDQVQVQSGAQVGQPPLVVQQIAGQTLGTVVVPPPPVIAQAWLAVAGQRLHLLAQTTTGGNDNLGVGQELSAGETVVVVWYGLAPGVSAWFRLRGTKYTLDT